VSKLAVFSSLFALIVMTGVCPSWSVAQSPWQQATLKPNRLSVAVEAKIFDRPGDDSNTPVVSDSVTNATLLSNERATDFGSNFGLEVRVNVPGNYGSSWEFRTLATDWDEQNTINGNSLSSPFFPDPDNPPQSLNYDIESDYFSFEIMRKRAVCPGLTVSGGPRFISISDELIVDSFLTTTDAVLGQITASQFNDFEAKNSLIGLQFGLEYNQPVAQSVYLTVFGRVGGYHNGTEFNTETSASDTLGISDMAAFQTRRTRSVESFVAEAGGRVNFEIIPNVMSTFIGYEATVIDGIALSAANIDQANTIRIDTSNTLFFQAITFGATMTY